MLQPEILALQECPSDVQLEDLRPVYVLVGATRAHAGYVQLYVKNDIVARKLDVGSCRAPAVFAHVSIGCENLVVVAAHFTANAKGDLRDEREGPDGRLEQMRAIEKALARGGHTTFVLLGDLNVRQDEARELFAVGEWRDAAYSGKSFEPRCNDFTGDVARSGRASSAQGYCFDRILFKGALCVQAYLTGTSRRFAQGRPYCLSDHYGVYGLMDVHACHGVRGQLPVREARRVDLGKLRDIEKERLKGNVRLQEKAAIEADYAAQQRVNEAQIQEALRERRRAVKLRHERRSKLCDALNGEGSLFAGSASVSFRAQAAVPLAPAEHGIAPYDGLLGAGRVAAWQEGCKGWPPLRGYSSVVRAVECAVQLFHRLLPVAVWLEEHAARGLCEGACRTCALQQCRQDMEARGDGGVGFPARRLHAPAEELKLGRLSCADYLVWLLHDLRRCERAHDLSVVGPQCEDITHVDRLFGFWEEVRKVCTICGQTTASFRPSTSWRVSLQGHAAPEASVTELFLQSCAATEDASQKCCSRVCCLRSSDPVLHRVQRRMATRPNVLLVQVDRGDGHAMGAQDRRPVRAEEQLELAALGHSNLELAGALYDYGTEKSLCACRDAEGSFWLFGGRDEPLCLGPDLADVLVGRVALVVYQRPGGAADFAGARSNVAKPAAGGVRGVAATDLQAKAGAAGARAAKRGLPERDAQLQDLVVMARSCYVSKGTFRDLYFRSAEVNVAKLCVRWENSRSQVSQVLCAVTMCASVDDVKVGRCVVDRVVLFLLVEPPFGPVEQFARFVKLCMRTRVRSDEEFQHLAALAASQSSRQSAAQQMALSTKERAAEKKRAQQMALSSKERAAEKKRVAAAAEARQQQEARQAGFDRLLGTIGGVSPASAAGSSNAGSVQRGRSFAAPETHSLENRPCSAVASSSSATAAKPIQGSRQLGLFSVRRGAGHRDAQADVVSPGSVGAGRATGSASRRAPSAPQRRTRSDELIGLLQRGDIGEIIVDTVVWVLGGRGLALACLNDDWSQGWHGWTELIDQIYDLSDVPDDVFLVQAMEYAQIKLRAFLVIAAQNRDIPGRTDDERLVEVRRQHGLRPGYGEVWGRNDCCADTLLQLLIEHGVLAGTITPAERDIACGLNRDALMISGHPPRNYRGEVDKRAYLEVERHAEPTVRFFEEHFRGRQTGGIPADGIEVVAYSRFDTDDDRRPPVRLRICAGRGMRRVGGPLVVSMYNRSGRGFIGCHYDPLFPGARRVGRVGRVPSGGVALEPVIQELRGEREGAAKLRRIQEAELWGDEMVLEGPGAEDGDVAEAVQRSLETAEHDAVGEAVRLSLESLDGHGTTAGGTYAPSGSAGVTVAAAAPSEPGAALPGAASSSSVDEQRVRPTQASEPSAAEGFARSARRRVGQQLDWERPLRRHGALVGDECEELPTALGRMVLSDSEDVGEVDVPARVRRLVRRSESEVSLGHADAELASRFGRVQMPGQATEPQDPAGGAGQQPELASEAHMLAAASSVCAHGPPDHAVGGAACVVEGATMAGVAGRGHGEPRARGRGRARGPARVEVAEPRRSSRLASRRAEGERRAK